MKKILVIGESCRDVFVYCSAKRLAPDLPIPVLKVIQTIENPGMAKNTERNVKAIYKSCDIFTNKDWRRITKTRFMHEATNHAFLRVDTEHTVERINTKKIPLAEYDIVAISDYDKGFMTEDDIRNICEAHNTVFVDTKKPIGDFAKRAKFIKINRNEYEKSLPISATLKRKIILTKGEDGVEFEDKKYPVEKVGVKDSSGAGDSFFAALVVRYAETDNIEESIVFANLCAAEVVRHRGVTIIKRPQWEKSN